jgi:prepilin-type processing-associated H-X9-DG protein
MTMESDGGEGAGNQANATAYDPTAGGEAWSTRHNGLANYGFVDGHAKALAGSKLDPVSSDWLTSMEQE